MIRRRSPWIGIAISAVLLALLFTQIDLRGVLDGLRRVDATRLWQPLLLIALGLAIRPLRWQLIFSPAQRPKLVDAFHVWTIANMANNILPARGGDLLRCFLIARGDRLNGASAALATLGLEKVLDGLALLVVILLSFLFLTPPAWLTTMVLLAAAVFGGALAVMVALQSRPAAVEALARRLLAAIGRASLGERVAGLLGSFAGGLAAVRSLSQMAALILLTALTWVIDAALVWSVANALGAPLTPWIGAVVAAVLGLGLMIPAAPGYVGSYEFFSVATLKMVGVGAEIATALTVTMHAGVLLMTTLFGVASLAASGIRWSRDVLGADSVAPENSAEKSTI